MTFLSPGVLWLLVLVPLLFLLALLRERRKPLAVSSLLIWQRVAKLVPDERKRLPDLVVWLMAASVLLAFLGAAAPALQELEDAPKPWFMLDPSAASLLEDSSGELALPIAKAQEKGFDPSRELLESNDPLTLEEVSARALRHGGAPGVLLSTRHFDALPSGVQQWSDAPSAESLPFTYLHIDELSLFAKISQPDSRYQVQTLNGNVLASAQAKGQELLCQLPWTGQPLQLVREGAREAKDRAYLLPLPRLRVSIKGIATEGPELAEHLAESMKDLVDLSDDSAADLSLSFNEARGRALVARQGEVFQGNRWAYDADNAAAQLIARWIREHDVPSTGLKPSSGERALVATYDDEDSERALLLLSADGQQLHMPREFWNQLTETAWLPLMVCAACESLTGRNPIGESRYLVSLTPPEGDPLLHPLYGDAPLTASPAFGLYNKGVRNPFTPAKDHLLKTSVTPDWDAMQPATTFSDLSALFALLAAIPLLFAAFLILKPQIRSSLSG